MDPVSVLLDSYELAAQSWLSGMIAAGNALFRTLAALELTVFGISVALLARQGGAETVLPRLVWKLFLIALLLTGLLLYPLWLPEIVPAFGQVASSVTGIDTLNPVTLLGQGVWLALALAAKSIIAGWAVPNPVGNFLVGLTVIGVVLSFAAIAAQVAKTLIESWIVLAAGPVFWAFSPFRPTSPLADNFFVYAVNVGIRLFFLILLTAVVGRVVDLWGYIILAGGIFQLQILFEIFAGSVLLAVTLWSVPARIADKLTAGWQLGIRRGLEA